MLYKEIIAVCSQIHIKHINTICGQNLEFVNVKLAVHRVITGLKWFKWALQNGSDFGPVVNLHLSVFPYLRPVN